MTQKQQKSRSLLLACIAGLVIAPGGPSFAAAKTSSKAAGRPLVVSPTPDPVAIARMKSAAPAATRQQAPQPAAAPVAPKGPSLYDALASAYQKNPDLAAIRAELKSIDENHAQAAAGFRPTVKGIADYTSSKAADMHSDPKQLALTVSQSLYAGGATVAGIDKADNQIKAERAKLQVTEQQVLLDAVSAYMAVIHDQQLVELNQNNEKVLKSHLDASEARFKLGGITKTDVSQAESRYAQATAQRIAAEGALKKSRAAFERSIGLSPDNLQKPVVRISLPKSEEEALSVALGKNPSIAVARYTEEEAKNNTRMLEAGNLPSVDLTGSVGKIYDPANSAAGDENASTVEVRATLPLYEGGATTSRIRQSRQSENQSRLQKQSAENNVREALIQAREGLAAAEAESASFEAQINAEKLALEGVQVETDYGSRTTLDLLDAEQEYLNARVNYVGAETDRIVATYSLLAALGELTAQDLKLDVPVYDPVANFQNDSGNAPAPSSMGITE